MTAIGCDGNLQAAEYGRPIPLNRFWLMPRTQHTASIRPLPTGTLTFLFTDVEGSTRLWGAHPEAMRQAVARHDALLRQCIEGRGGHVFKTAGDAFCAAFATAPDSMAAALSAQQALRAERWTEGLPIRVRMAVHTGAAEFRDGDYFGAPLNYVARLLALGHGGQTLVSEITQGLCRDRLPVGATLKLLGDHPLKDVGPAEKVFQLCHAGLPSSFPPLRTAAAESREASSSVVVGSATRRLGATPAAMKSGFSKWIVAGLGLAALVLAAFIAFRPSTKEPTTVAPTKLAAETTPTSGVPKPDPNSVAVLPFTNLSDDRTNEYFSDGISEELLTVLQKIPGLRVAARMSAFSFKGKNSTAQEIGEKLGVANLVEGSVRKSGKSVRITARLSRAATGEQIWSASYTRDVKNVFAVQSELAQTIVEQLRGQLGGTMNASAKAELQAQVQAAAKGGTKNAEAFQLYLQGKFYGERPKKADTDKAIELFQRALAIDPNFALAWAGLAHVHWVQAGSGFAPRDESYERAREAAQHALHLAPDLAEAHTALGYVQQSRDWNWTAAEASFRRALELAPGNTNALFAAARLAQVLGRLDDARELARKAVALDPLSPWKHSRLGWISVDNERFEDAAASFQFALDLAPNAGPYHANLAMARLLQGRKQEALSIAQAESDNADGDRNLALAMIHHSLGHPAESDAALKAVIDGYAWNATYQIADVYAYRNEVDKAFEWLERAYAERDPGVTFVLADRFLHSLHGDPRWQPFLQKMKLADTHR